MKFELKTKGNCEQNISYQYYDDYSIAYDIYKTSFQLYPYDEKIKDDYNIKFYSLEKSIQDLNGLYGHYLLLQFNCNDKFEIKSVNPNIQSEYIVLIIMSIVIVLIGAITVFVCLNKKIRSNNTNTANKNKINRVSAFSTIQIQSYNNSNTNTNQRMNQTT
jgi:hypothetical protein